MSLKKSFKSMRGALILTLKLWLTKADDLYGFVALILTLKLWLAKADDLYGFVSFVIPA